MRHVLLLALLLLTAAAPPPDSPEACTLERRGSLAVSFAGNQPLVQINLDGRDATLLLDTGAEVTMLTADAARRLMLPTDPQRRTTITGIGGTSSSANVLARRVTLGAAPLGERSLAVLPFALRGANAPVDGLLGADLLSQFDLDLDLPHGQVQLYRARDCVSGTPAWREPAAIKADISRGPGRTMLHLPITLDGRGLTAMIDTGADTGPDLGVIDTRAATALGTTAETLRETGRFSIHGAAPSDASARRHRFTSAAIGLENLSRPTLLVADLPRGSADVLIGIGFARTHRLWISYASRRMFVSYPIRP